MMKYKIISPKKQEELILLESFKKELAPYIFTERQIEVLKKKIRNDKLTQTERNYLSNSIKKKFQALNILFHTLNFSELANDIYSNNSNQKFMDLSKNLTINNKRNIEAS